MTVPRHGRPRPRRPSVRTVGTRQPTPPRSLGSCSFAWVALFFNVLAPGGKPDPHPDSPPLSQALAQGSLFVALALATAREPPPRRAPQPLRAPALSVLAVSLAGREPAQRVLPRVDVPRRAPARLRRCPLVAVPVVGPSRPGPPARAPACACGGSSHRRSWERRSPPARPSPSRVGSPGRSGRCRPPRWPTTPPCCSAPR